MVPVALAVVPADLAVAPVALAVVPADLAVAQAVPAVLAVPGLDSKRPARQYAGRA